MTAVACDIDLESICRQVRYDVISMCQRGEAAHLASAWSCVDLLVALYFGFLNGDPKNPSLPTRDRFILSKGHAVAALYATLAQRGFFSLEQLETFNLEGSALSEHAFPGCVPGLELATGSLGHGLSVGAGYALAGKLAHLAYSVVVLLSDGECNEGSVWEAALFAPAKKLHNLIAVIDFNKWQGIDRTANVLQIFPLKEKWEAFGWDVYEVDGHHMPSLLTLFENLKQSPREKPTAIIAHTIKGKGAAFTEDDNNWHYRIPSEADVARAREVLGII